MRTPNTPKKEGNNTAQPKSRASDSVRTEERHQLLQLVGGTDLSLEQLLKVCLQSDQETLWTEFVRRSQPIIAGVIVKTIRNWTKPGPDFIDDLVQETYLKLCFNDFRVLRRFVPRHDKALHGFLKVVASNTVRDHFRSAYSRKRGGGVTEVPLDCVAELPVLKRPFESFERGALLREIESKLEAFSGSPSFARDRMIFSLYYGNGLTAEAISQLRSIGLSPKGVESTILRVVRFIKLTMRGHET